MLNRKFRTGFLLLAVVGSCPLHAQLVVNNTLTPTQIVQQVLLGPGVTASNIQFSGDPNQLGTFLGLNSNIGLSNGMIMCSGDISVAVGPNVQTGASLGGGNFGVGDPDLDLIVAPITTNDRAVLEFDFVPTGDSVKFNFVFASEEYNEYVCGTVNDVFAFFLSGPGLSGPFTNNAANIALIPGTNVPVQINSVNNGTVGANGTLANCVAADPNWQSNNVFFTDNTNGTTVEFDGFTVVMTALAQVICGQTYHIKIALADAGDTVFDSGVFIEAGSFQSNSVTVVGQVIAGGIDSVFYEGCGEALITLVRNGVNTVADTVDIVMSGTATEGVDYDPVPDQVFFPVGVDTAVISISAILDTITEGQETIILTAINEGNCGIDSVTITIFLEEAPDLNVVLSNDTALTCPGDSVLIAATVSGGFGNYFLDWDSGPADGSFSGYVSPVATTTYTLTVTDDCGVVTVVEDVVITVPVPDPLLLTALPDTTVFCPESPVQLGAAVQGGSPGYTYLWSNGLGTSAAANVAPPITKSYTLTVTDACGWDTSDVVTVTVQYDTVDVVILNDTTICYGGEAVLFADASQGWGGYAYSWNNGVLLDQITVSPSDDQSYDVVVTDGCGIQATDDVLVRVNEPIAAFSYTGTVYVSNYPIQFLDESIGAVTWSWDFDHPDLSSTEQYPVVSFVQDGTFNVMLAITDQKGCVDTTYRTIFIDPEFQFYAPNAFSPNGDGINEVFIGSGVGIATYRMRIYDRWGELIYETEDPGEPWDGTRNGTECQVGVYAYSFRLQAIAGKVSEILGHVTLIR